MGALEVPMITDEQVRLLRQKMTHGFSQQAAAAASGMSPRAARKWQSGPLPSQRKKPRHWRTRADPFEEVWDSDILPLLLADSQRVLKATVLFEEIQRRYPGKFEDGQLRSLQRRLRDWFAIQGPEKEVFFEQIHPPGREAAFDFTHAKSLGVTIQDELFDHLIFTFKLSHSGWIWHEIAYGETYEALVSGIQNALWELGGVPEIVRHDNLSAATHELRKSPGRSLNRRYQDFIDHFQMKSTRINPGKSHENGIAEKANDLCKSTIRQALLLRGNSDFDSEEDYAKFLAVCFARQNGKLNSSFLEELETLRPLPQSRFPTYTEFQPKVRRWSTIHIAKRTYSVPSRLIGHQVLVRQYPNQLDVFYRGKLIETLPRIRGDASCRIDYRHIIHSLIHKPGAFAQYRFREELFPTLNFRRAYDQLKKRRGDRSDIEYVRILHLAATNFECQVDQVLQELLDQGVSFDYAQIQELVSPKRIEVPNISIPNPDLSVYDDLLNWGGAA